MRRLLRKIEEYQEWWWEQANLPPRLIVYRCEHCSMQGIKRIPSLIYYAENLVPNFDYAHCHKT